MVRGLAVVSAQVPPPARLLDVVSQIAMGVVVSDSSNVHYAPAAAPESAARLGLVSPALSSLPASTSLSAVNSLSGCSFRGLEFPEA